MLLLHAFIRVFILLFVYLSIRYFYTALWCCLFISLSPFFILTLLLYLCLLLIYVNKSIIFVFGALVYYFKNSYNSNKFCFTNIFKQQQLWFEDPRCEVLANSCMRRVTNKYCLQKGCKQTRITNDYCCCIYGLSLNSGT